MHFFSFVAMRAIRLSIKHGKPVSVHDARLLAAGAASSWLNPVSFDVWIGATGRANIGVNKSKLTHDYNRIGVRGVDCCNSRRGCEIEDGKNKRPKTTGAISFLSHFSLTKAFIRPSVPPALMSPA